MASARTYNLNSDFRATWPDCWVDIKCWNMFRDAFNERWALTNQYGTPLEWTVQPVADPRFPPYPSPIVSSPGSATHVNNWFDLVYQTYNLGYYFLNPDVSTLTGRNPILQSYSLRFVPNAPFGETEPPKTLPGAEGWTRKYEAQTPSLAYAAEGNARFLIYKGYRGTTPRDYPIDNAMNTPLSEYTFAGKIMGGGTRPSIISKKGFPRGGDMIGPWILEGIAECLKKFRYTIGGVNLGWIGGIEPSDNYKFAGAGSFFGDIEDNVWHWGAGWTQGRAVQLFNLNIGDLDPLFIPYTIPTQAYPPPIYHGVGTTRGGFAASALWAGEKYSPDRLSVLANGPFKFEYLTHDGRSVFIDNPELMGTTEDAWRTERYNGKIWITDSPKKAKKTLYAYCTKWGDEFNTFGQPYPMNTYFPAMQWQGMVEEPFPKVERVPFDGDPLNMPSFPGKHEELYNGYSFPTFGHGYMFSPRAFIVADHHDSYKYP